MFLALIPWFCFVAKSLEEDDEDEVAENVALVSSLLSSMTKLQSRRGKSFCYDLESLAIVVFDRLL